MDENHIPHISYMQAGLGREPQIITRSPTSAMAIVPMWDKTYPIMQGECKVDVMILLFIRRWVLYIIFGIQT